MNLPIPIPEDNKQKHAHYPEYRDSGVDWLGEIPAHWEVKRLKHLSFINPSKTEIKDLPQNLEVSFLPMEDIGTSILCIRQSRELHSIYKGFTYFRDGDVLVAKITPCFENGKGAICKGLLNSIGFGTTELHIIRPNPDAYGEFLHYISISYAFRNIGESEMYGAAGQKRVSDSFIKDFVCPEPPINQQQAIADYLDQETAKIDQLVEKKKRLIELLEEQRTAMITHAVTKGLNPGVEMKDSGVEWLGEIPAHWGAKRLKYLSKLIMGQSPNSDDYLYDNFGIPFLQGNAEFTSLNPSPVVWCDTAKKMALKGDILVSVRAPIGAVNVADQMYGIGRGLCAIRGLNAEQKYLYYVTLSSSLELNSIGTGSTYTAISTDQLGNLMVSCPSLYEQQVIADYLDKETARIDNLINKINQAIEKLQEYRSALITAAVTGKIDVRQHVS